MGSFVMHRWTTRFSLLRRISAGPLRSDRDYADRKLGARMMMMSTAVNSSPWLMLPPVFEEGGGDMVYKFYNLSEEKEESFRRFKSEEEMADDDAKFVGSSHGWLALLNQRSSNNNHLFLYNPITRRHIKLPPIDTLLDPRIYLTPDGLGSSVSKLVLSSSPDDDNDECIAMMAFGPADRLAFCHPCRSTEWTPIGNLFFPKDFENPFMGNGMDFGRAYEDFVYCGGLKRFTCITQFEIDLFNCCLCLRYPSCELEDWDLSDPHSPKSHTSCWTQRFKLGGEEYIYGWSQRLRLDGEEWMTQNLSLLDKCRTIPYLIFSEQHNQLFIVFRFIMDRVAQDGSYVSIGEIPYDPISRRLLVDTYPYKTTGFCVLKVEYELQEDGDRAVKEVRLVQGGSLDGLVMFLGMNHSFAVSAAEFPNLKPNSIYFTDANKNANSICGGHDIGIFDYENKTLSSCYSYPCVDVPSLKRIAPPPMWFTPSLY